MGDPIDDDALIEEAVALAAQLVDEGRRREPGRQRRRARRLSRLVNDPEGMALTMGLTDEVVRIENRRRAARRFHDIVTHSRPGPAFTLTDRVLLRTGAAIAPVLPGVVMPLVVARLKHESYGVVLPAEDPAFTRHLRRRRQAGLKTNVNVLGEAVLGEGEARRRLDDVITRVRRPDVSYISVKASSICAQLSTVAFEQSVERVCERLRRLFFEARRHRVFVNLDMEEHRDLELTLEAFERVLDEPDLLDTNAGIVLQAYLPDAHAALGRLIDWDRDRPGGLKVRVVKGANLPMEQVDAELHDWPQAPYTTKAETDASWKRLVELLLSTDTSVRVGAASHNLFDVAWALRLAEQLGQRERLDIEMLEGMAEGEALAVGGTLLYAPVVRSADFDAAIAYLVRRLDEGTAPGHFLTHLFDLTSTSRGFLEEAKRFREAARQRHEVSTEPRRTQNRDTEQRRFDAEAPFENEPDTDWSIAANRQWVSRHLQRSKPPRPPGLRRTVKAVDDAVATGRRAARRWASSTPNRRRALLTAVAERMAAGRGEAVACMAHEAGKTVLQGDPEVSEAVDFARYYSESTRFLQDADADTEPLGVVVVAPPWNFPYAIPAGGVLAALAAGNAVILKPAPETVRTAALLVSQLHDAGVPPDLVQLLRVPDDDVGRHLVTHPDVDAMILTGAAATAELFLDWKPVLRLHAETSGKNALVITATADLDLAVRDLVTSAFGHAGQKCSAASLAIVEKAVLGEERFLRKLEDTVRTLRTGPATDLSTDVGPVIREPEGWLADALHELEAGERWLVEPTELGDRLWSPGVKLGVRPGSRSHLEEWFGPVLGIMEAADLDEAIELQNTPAFGLTGGIHALDPAEVEIWLDRVEAGNVYVNRHITGAIVRRQPFGGWKRSVVGPGAKAGGPGYVASLCRWSERDGDGDRLDRARRSYAATWEVLGRPQDPSGLSVETNELLHRPLPGVLLRIGDGSDPGDVELCRLASATTGTPLEEISDDTLLADRLGASSATRLRCLGELPPDEIYRLANKAWVHVMTDRPVSEGRVELRRWVREQAVSRTNHRYGRVLRR